MPPSYVALKPFPVKMVGPDGADVIGDDGQPRYRDVKRGDPLPEALHWPQVRTWAAQGYIGLAEHFVPDPPAAAVPTPSAAAEAEEAPEAPPRRRKAS